MNATEEKRMDTLLPASEKSAATEVLEFLEELNQEEQRDFMSFLHGAKFVMALGSKEPKATV